MRYNFKEEFVCKVQQSSFAAADSVGHQRRQEGIYTKSLESSTATRENYLQRPKISEWGRKLRKGNSPIRLMPPEKMGVMVKKKRDMP